MMKITLNGKPCELSDGTNVAAMLSQMDMDPLRLAVERNMEIVRRADYDVTTLADGDDVEIVTLVGGG